MNYPMKQSVPYDHKALTEALNQLELSPIARRIGQYMVDKLEYEYCITQNQIRKGLVLPADCIEPALNELIDKRFVRQQPRVDSCRTYALDRRFFKFQKSANAAPEMTPMAPPRARPKLRLILGGKH
jgi:hypothetical protein